METVELKRCPFCKQQLSGKFTIHLDDGTWVLLHHCETEDDEELPVVIRVYGNSKEEVIERWNRRADDGAND